MHERDQWWGYRHTNGSVQAKRYHDPREIDDAVESDLVARVVMPFYADSREEALQIVADKTV